MSRYVETFFGKEAKSIEISDLQAFFSDKQYETSTVEFKSGDVEINDVFKEITAFLNTEGGLLIIGAPKETKDQKKMGTNHFCQGNLTYSKFANSDWLRQKIYSNITPSPIDISIYEKEYQDGLVFLLDIPQSSAPPHQCNSDGRYYIRIGTESRPAPHGLIQALFNKRKAPQLSAKLDVQKYDDFSEIIYISIHNNSPIPADKISYIVEVINAEVIGEDHKFKTLNDAVFGKKYSFNETTNQVLVQVLSIQEKFRILSQSSEYIIMVGYWCKDVDFNADFWTINSKSLETVFNAKYNSQEKSIVDEYNRITKKE